MANDRPAEPKERPAQRGDDRPADPNDDRSAPAASRNARNAPGAPAAPLEAPGPRFVELADPDGHTRWVLDAGFLGSGWRCRWGRGCQGIHDEPTPELAEGCCSVGVVLADEEEAMTVAALAATMEPAGFQHAADADAGVVVHDGSRWSTRVLDGACIFFNRVGFAGGTGCALHLAALAEGGDPIDYKPWTCSKLPLRTEERTLGDGTVEVTVRAWRRDDWGPGGRTMAWWCTEATECFDDERPVVDRLAPELVRILGDEVYAAARAALASPPGPADTGTATANATEPRPADLAVD